MTFRDSNTLTPSQVAEILGVSQATVRNWIKLGRLSAISTRPILLSGSEVAAALRSLDESPRLTSRRNKSRVSGRHIPISYIDRKSPNHLIVKRLVAALSGDPMPESAVLFYYAKELLAKVEIPTPIADELLSSLLSSFRESNCANPYADLDVDLMSFLSDYPLTYIPGEDTLGMLYLSLGNLREKKSTGTYYTPFFVADRLIADLGDFSNSGESSGLSDLSSLRVLDPGCGTGNFLIRLPASVPLDAIYGSDIDPVAVCLTRINLALKFKIIDDAALNTIKRNITIRNFLSDKTDPVSADVILGNPPWGYSFSAPEQRQLSANFKSCHGQARPESFSLFIEKSFYELSPGGRLSFVLPESILESGSHTSVREVILEHSHVRSLSYLGDVFDKVQCPGIILTLEKKNCDPAPNNRKVRVSMFSKKGLSLNLVRSYSAAHERLSASDFHLLSDDREFELLEKIRSVPHFTLKGQADFALGIVTGDNKELLKDAPGKDLEPIIRGKDISAYHLAKSGQYVKFAPESFQQCAPTELYRAKEKLFYRFIAPYPIVARDCEGLLSLNSANIIVPRVPGYNAAYIMAVLNSGVIRFYYSKTFRNMKVLRSALESLPIPCCDKKTMAEIEALASEAESGKSGENAQKMLDSKVFECYGITNDLKWRF